MFYQHLKSVLLFWSKKAGIAVSVQRQGYWLDEPGFDSYQGQQIFHISRISRSVQGPSCPSVQRVPGAVVLGLNGPGNEGDCSCPSVAEVKNEWSCTSSPPIAYIGTRSHVRNSVPADCIEVCDICVCHSNTAEDSHLLGCYAMAIVALKFVACCTIVINNSISYTAPVLEFCSVKI